MTSTPREAEVATAGRSEFAVEIEGLHKWSASSTCCATSICRCDGASAIVDLRPVGIGQIDAAALHQRSRALPAR